MNKKPVALLVLIKVILSSMFVMGVIEAITHSSSSSNPTDLSIQYSLKDLRKIIAARVGQLVAEFKLFETVKKRLQLCAREKRN